MEGLSIQGWFSGNEVPFRHFLFSFYRQRLAVPDGEAVTGHTLLISHVGADGARPARRNQISEPVVALCLETLRNGRFRYGSGGLAELLSEDIRRFGPPRPVRIERAPVRLRGNGLEATWADMQLRFRDDVLHWYYTSPENGQPCRLTGRPGRLFMPPVPAKEESNPIREAVLPRLPIEGEINGEAVAGEAWFERRADAIPNDPIADPSRETIREWFRMQVDGHGEILLTVHRRVRTREIVAAHAEWIEDGQASPLTSFSMDAARYWENPVTCYRYPVAWDLAFPEKELRLSLEPLTEEQEWILFGASENIWAGAGVLRGTRRGRPVTGKAWIELHGYGHAANLGSSLERWSQRIDGHIRRYLPPVLEDTDLERLLGRGAPHAFDSAALTAMLSRPAWDLLERGGKRWRPVFGSLLLEALGVSHAPYAQLLAVIGELTHLGSLIIDDIEDQSLLRRNQPTIHRRYGTDLAINAGNALYFLPLLLIEKHPSLTVSQRDQIYRVIVRYYMRSHIGQSMDLYWSKYMTPEHLDRWLEEGLDRRVLAMYADKTGSAVQVAAEIACILADAEESVRRDCLDFARAFGIAFQIHDDVLNFNSSGNWTKTPGEDLAMGKPTYVVIRALMANRGEARAHLRGLLCDAAFRNQPAHLQRGIEHVRSCGVLEECLHQARSMVRAPWERMAFILPPSEARTMLRLLCAHLTDGV